MSRTLRATPPRPQALDPLPPAQARWPQHALLSAAGGLGGFGVVPLLGDPALANPILAAGLAGSGACVAAGIRDRRRRELLDQVVVALAPAQGTRAPMRRAVKASRWTTPWSSTPRHLAVSYAPGIDTSPEWKGALIDIVERIYLTPFEVRRHDRRRCRIVLQVKPAAAPAEEKSQEVERAERVLRNIFGETAHLALDVGEGNAVSGIEIKHSLGAKVARAQARTYIENTLTALLPGRWRAHWQLTEDSVTFELRPIMPTSVPHDPAPVTAKNLNLIPLARDEDGRDVYWNLGGSGPHLLVVGKTGTGKTVAINGVVMEAARRAWRVWVIDPKRIEFMGLRGWPNVQIVATDVPHQVALIKHAHDLMEDRYRQIEEGADESDFEPLILVLDEFRNLHRLITAWYAAVKVKGMPTKCPVFDWISAIAEKGRSGRVHLVLGTQRPDADFLTGSMRDNFDSRLALGRLSPQGAQMMWESPYLGVSVPRKIRGRGTGITDDERVEEVQVLWTPDPRRAHRDANGADLALLEALRPERSTHPPLQVELAPDVDLDGAVFTEWHQVMESDLVPAGAPSSLETSRVPLTKAPAALIEISDDDESDDDDVEPQELDPFEGYGPERTTSAGRVEPGDLVQHDDSLDLWGVVEAVDADGADEEYVCIAWRDDEGDSGDLSLNDDDTVTVRRPLEDAED